MCICHRSAPGPSRHRKRHTIPRSRPGALLLSKLSGTTTITTNCYTTTTATKRLRCEIHELPSPDLVGSFFPKLLLLFLRFYLPPFIHPFTRPRILDYTRGVIRTRLRLQLNPSIQARPSVLVRPTRFTHLILGSPVDQTCTSRILTLSALYRYLRFLSGSS